MAKIYHYPLKYFHVSNLFTYINLISAFFCLSLCFLDLSTQKSLHFLAVFMGISLLADCFDGRFARRFKRTEAMEAMGIQLDSLADLLAFGLCPTLIYFLFTDGAFGMSLILPTMYLLSVFKRLAFYNSLSAQEDYFIGMPCPTGNLYWLFLLCFPNLINIYTLSFGYLCFSFLYVAPIKFKRPSKYVLSLGSLMILYFILMNTIKALRL